LDPDVRIGSTASFGFPADQNYPAAAAQRSRMALAARVRLVRGDLWAELFFSFSDSIISRSGRDFGAIETLNEALPVAQRALLYAPYRSEVWLLLADMAEDYELPYDVLLHRALQSRSCGTSLVSGNARKRGP